MNRRALLGGLLVAPAGARGQTGTQGRIYRLGVLVPTQRTVGYIRDVALPELARLGYGSDRNLVVDLRVGAADQAAALAREIVAARPDAILAISAVAAVAARQATETVPIVIMADNPVELGLAVSIARPGSNVTGVIPLSSELDGKRLQLLVQAFPGLDVVAALVHPASPTLEARRRDMEAVARAAGLHLVFLEARGPDTYGRAYAEMRSANARALVVTGEPQFLRDARALADLSVEARLPTICQWRDSAEQGCLMSYAPNLPALYRRTADLLARIFAGASPGELSIEGPTQLELVVNLKTARALGLDLPATFLARADEVIE